jgi:hypothetical protein
MIPLRLYIYGAIALAAIGAVAYVRHLQTSNTRLAAELSTAQKSLTAERENTRKANEASERYATSLENLKAARAATPVRSVRLCVSTPVPAATAPTGTDGTNPEGLPQTAGRHLTAGRNIGLDLYELADEADLCPVKLKALQEWVRGR